MHLAGLPHTTTAWEHIRAPTPTHLRHSRTPLTCPQDRAAARQGYGYPQRGPPHFPDHSSMTPHGPHGRGWPSPPARMGALTGPYDGSGIRDGSGYGRGPVGAYGPGKYGGPHHGMYDAAPPFAGRYGGPHHGMYDTAPPFAGGTLRMPTAMGFSVTDTFLAAQQARQEPLDPRVALHTCSEPTRFTLAVNRHASRLRRTQLMYGSSCHWSSTGQPDRPTNLTALPAYRHEPLHRMFPAQLVNELTKMRAYHEAGHAYYTWLQAQRGKVLHQWFNHDHDLKVKVSIAKGKAQRLHILSSFAGMEPCSLRTVPVDRAGVPDSWRPN
eukprot:354633-Chlamydomonas_euryale.AAC.2